MQQQQQQQLSRRPSGINELNKRNRRSIEQTASPTTDDTMPSGWRTDNFDSSLRFDSGLRIDPSLRPPESYDTPPTEDDGRWVNADFGISVSMAPQGVTEMDMTPLGRFNRMYQEVHGYLSIVVCAFGICSNIINIIVLTRKTMITPTNCLLTAIAVADLLTMVSYLPYSAYFYCYGVLDSHFGHARGWVIYLIFHTNFVITCHTVAMWLTVVLAIFRYVVVCQRLHGNAVCSMSRAKLSIGIVILSTIVCCFPNYLIYRPIEVTTNASSSSSSPSYWVTNNTFITDRHMAVQFWLFGVVLKVAPCFLLTVLSGMIIRIMRIVDRKRQRLRSPLIRRGSERVLDGDHHRTTMMLVAVVLSFVAAELPQGVIALLSGVDSDVFYEIYVPLGDVWDILVLVNSAVNFVLYCSMSRQYRRTFERIFIKQIMRPGPSSRNQNSLSYYNINVKMSVL